jgi:hypothetical protein
VLPTAHTPVPVQVPQLPLVQVPVAELQVTVLVCVPQLPQAWLSAGFDATSQSITLQVPHAPQEPPLQEAVQVLVCVPFVPQA